MKRLKSISMIIAWRRLKKTVALDPVSMILNGRQHDEDNETEQLSEHVIVKSRKTNLKR